MSGTIVEKLFKDYSILHTSLCTQALSVDCQPFLSTANLELCMTAL